MSDRAPMLHLNEAEAASPVVAGLNSIVLDFAARTAVGGTDLSRDSPDQTNFPGNSSFWDTVKYNPAFQGRQMRPDSLKFPVFI